MHDTGGKDHDLSSLRTDGTSGVRVIFLQTKTQLNVHETKCLNLQASEIGSTVATSETAVAAAARADAAEIALSEALESVEELEARCARAQARELQAGRQAATRVEELKRELEEVTENGPKVSSTARVCVFSSQQQHIEVPIADKIHGEPKV